MMTIVKTTRLCSGLKPENGMPRRPTTYKPPATPARAPENAKAVSFARIGWIPNVDAARSLSRTATTVRPMRPLRKLRERMTATTATRMHRYAKVRGSSREKRDRNSGRGTLAGVNAGTCAELSRNVDTGTPKANVVTARNSPRIRRAGMPTRIAASPPATADATSARKRSACRWTSMLPVVPAPRPTKAN